MAYHWNCAVLLVWVLTRILVTGEREEAIVRDQLAKEKRDKQADADRREMLRKYKEGKKDLKDKRYG